MYFMLFRNVVVGQGACSAAAASVAAFPLLQLCRHRHIRDRDSFHSRRRRDRDHGCQRGHCNNCGHNRSHGCECNCDRDNRGRAYNRGRWHNHAHGTEYARCGRGRCDNSGCGSGRDYNGIGGNANHGRNPR
jgi:hypothetical protein